jgi:hypothetical protein
MPDPACAVCGQSILPTDDKMTFHSVPYHHACWKPKTRQPKPDDAVCSACGKRLSIDADVREGEKRFHLDCYRLYKRRASSR